MSPFNRLRTRFSAAAAVVAAAALVVVGLPSSVAAATMSEFSTTPIRTISGFKNPTDVLVSSKGTIIVLDNRGSSSGMLHRITEWSTSPDTVQATLLRSMDIPGLNSASLALDSSDNLYLLYKGLGTVTEYASDWTSASHDPVRVLEGSNTKIGWNSYQVAVDSAGLLYVGVRGAVNVYASDWSGDTAPIRQITGASTGIGATAYIAGLAINPAGQIVVSTGGSILRFASDANGNVAPVSLITGLGSSFTDGAMALDSTGNVFTAADFSLFVQQYDAAATGAATPVHSLGGTPLTSTALGDIAVDAYGNLWTSNSQTVNSVQSGTVTEYGFDPASTATSVTPDNGNVLGGTTVTIAGTNFKQNSTVTVGGVDCPVSAVNGTTEIVCATPASATSGAKDVVVTTPGTKTPAPLTFTYTFEPAPTVSSIAPLSGNVLGGNDITITGTGFGASSTVTVAGASCPVVGTPTSTEIVCTVAAHAVGPVNVLVATPGRAAASPATYTYTYYPNATVSSITPTSGNVLGGNDITIAGANFRSTSTVTVAGENCPIVGTPTSAEIVCTVPAHAAGSTDVVITTPGSETAATSSYTYTNYPAPVVSQIAPSSGNVLGGFDITITGTGFDSVSTVTVDGASCPVVGTPTSTQVVCTVPAHALGAVDVLVARPGALAATPAVFTYTKYAAPTVSSVTPSSGTIAGGTSITIAGSGFVEGSTVTVGGTSCPVTGSITSSAITCTTGAHASGDSDVVVSRAGAYDSAPVTYTYLDDAPTITSVSPSRGTVSGGTDLTIIGTGFKPGSTVTVGGTPCAVTGTTTSTQVTCTTGAHASGATDVLVDVPLSLTGQPGSFDYIDLAPVISSVTPSSGTIAGGTTISIAGTGIIPGSTVTVDGVDCPVTGTTTPTRISCTTAAHSSGPVDVVIKRAFMFDSLPATYTYLDAAPTITSVTPSTGTVSGGTSITVVGTGFKAGSTVTVGGTACAVTGTITATQITCTTGAHASGASDVAVDVPLSEAGVPGSFTYLDLAPTLTRVSPSSGPIAGGTSITVTGTRFKAGSTVTVGGVDCPVTGTTTATTITCTTGAHASGNADIVVTVPVSDPLVTPITFAYLDPAPAVSGVSPALGPVAGGTTITITGSNFKDGSTVTVGGVACAVQGTPTADTITCVTGAHASGDSLVSVEAPFSEAGVFTRTFAYTDPAPVLTSIAPARGPLAGGTTVTVTGSGFKPGTTVSIGGGDCAVTGAISPTEVTCVTSAAQQSGVVQATVAVPFSYAPEATLDFTHLDVPATVTAVRPDYGWRTGGDDILIVGTGFKQGSTVSIGGADCVVKGVILAGRITCTTGETDRIGRFPVQVTVPLSEPTVTRAVFRYTPEVQDPPTVNLTGYPVVKNGRLVGGMFKAKVTPAEVINEAPPATRYVVTVQPGGKRCTVLATDGDMSCEITGLNARQRYSATAVAVNANGASVPSAPASDFPTRYALPPIATGGAMGGANCDIGRYAVWVDNCRFWFNYYSPGEPYLDGKAFSGYLKVRAFGVERKVVRGAPGKPSVAEPVQMVCVVDVKYTKTRLYPDPMVFSFPENCIGSGIPVAHNLERDRVYYRYRTLTDKGWGPATPWGKGQTLKRR